MSVLCWYVVGVKFKDKDLRRKGAARVFYISLVFSNARRVSA